MADPSVLYHFPFQPASRAARLALGEARIDWIDTPVRPWEEDCPVHDLNPSGLPPVLLAGRVVIGFRPRRTPWILRGRMTCGTWSRPIPRHPRRIS